MQDVGGRRDLSQSRCVSSPGRRTLPFLARDEPQHLPVGSTEARFRRGEPPLLTRRLRTLPRTALRPRIPRALSGPGRGTSASRRLLLPAPLSSCFRRNRSVRAVKAHPDAQVVTDVLQSVHASLDPCLFLETAEDRAASFPAGPPLHPAFPRVGDRGCLYQEFRGASPAEKERDALLQTVPDLRTGSLPLGENLRSLGEGPDSGFG
jgi:hypothetical protein